MAWIYTVEFDYKKPFIIEMTFRWYDPFPGQNGDW